MFVVSQFYSWAKARRKMRPGWRRLFAFMMYLPKTAIVAFAIATAVTIVGALIVRWIVRPHMARWLGARRPSPSDDEDEMADHFHLDPNETVVVGYPARRVAGHGSRPGRLVRTDRRLWFFPKTWDEEPWWVPLSQIREVRTARPARLLWGLVEGLPERIVVDGGPETLEIFEVADPVEVRSWFEHPWFPQSRGVA
jgi:hypothetical protein